MFNFFAAPGTWIYDLYLIFYCFPMRFLNNLLIQDGQEETNFLLVFIACKLLKEAIIMHRGLSKRGLLMIKWWPNCNQLITLIIII